MHSVFTFPTRILFGEGARAQLGAELLRLDIHRPMVVTDPVVGRLEAVAALIRAVPGAVVFDAVKANPTEEDVRSGVGAFRDGGRDGLLAIGGGSAIDTAKAMRLLATHPGEFGDYDYVSGGMDRITANLPPLVAMPTTSGTGTEAARGTLIQVAATGRKVLALSPYLLPSVSICDPILTMTMPPAVTAGAGMDAFTHCIESYLSTTYHPICDGIAMEGLRHLAKGIEAATRDGSDKRARRETMMGALLGGISFHKGLGVVHSLSHALGGEGRAHHGTLNAILLPHALRFNLPCAEAALSELAFQLGVGRGVHGPEHLITLTELVLMRLPLPDRLGKVAGLERSRIPHYARLAQVDHCHRTNPRPCTISDFEVLLDQAW